MSEIIYLIENAEQSGSLQEIEAGRSARIEYEKMCLAISSLRSKVQTLEACGEARICKKCKDWYLVGYVCSCGHDNS